MNCPKCNSTQTKIKEYTGKDAYMGTWINCKRCGVNTQLIITTKKFYSPHDVRGIFTFKLTDSLHSKDMKDGTE